MILVYKNGKLQPASQGAQYDGDKTGGEFSSWKTHSVDPAQFIKESYGKLSSRSVTLYNTSQFARAAVNKPLMYSVGDGLVFRSLPDAHFLGMKKEEAVEWGRTFTELLHYDKLAIDYYTKQYELASECSITGDSILFFLRDEEGVPFDLVTTGGAAAIDWQHKAEENEYYTLGIKTDQYNRRKGFWSCTADKFVPFKNKDNSQNALQMRFAGRAGEIRGTGLYSASIALLKNIDRVWDATVERMVAESIQMGYFNASTTDVVGQARGMAEMATGVSLSSDKDNAIREVQGNERKPGGMYVLGNDEGMTFNDLKTPSNNFVNANEWALNLISMDRVIAPEFILGKYSTSFTAHKGALNDTMKRIKWERELFIRKIDTKVNLEYLKDYVKRGLLKVKPSFWTDKRVQLAYLQGKTLGPVPGHVSPLQEIKSDIEAVKAGFALPSDMSVKYGHNDITNMLGEWEEQMGSWYNASPEQKQKTIIAETAAE